MDKISELLTRGVDKIYPTSEDLEKLLRSGKKLKLYQGFDPTGTRLHIGHMVGFKKLRQWQDLGHHVIFLIGDGTGQAGDPSGKTTGRDKFLSRDELRANAVDYVKQAGKIVRFDGENPIEIRFNGDWLNELKLSDILDIAGHFTWQQLSERDLFQERVKNNQPINLREFLYPLLQAYDSVAMEVDLELGGTDQTFNMLAGRSLMKSMKGKDKFVMTTPLLADSNGRKIGKTEGNVIGLTDAPNELFGKIMTLGDDVIVPAFEYLTDISISEIEEMSSRIKSGENPITFKKKLAYEITKQLNSETDAKNAQDVFEGNAEEEVREIDVGGSNLSEIILETNLLSSMSEIKRKFSENGIKVNGEVPQNLKVQPKSNDVISIGRNKVKVIKK